MGLVKRGVLADGAINADVICVVNYFTGRGEHFPGIGVARLRDRLFEVMTNCISSFLFRGDFTKWVTQTTTDNPNQSLFESFCLPSTPLPPASAPCLSSDTQGGTDRGSLPPSLGGCSHPTSHSVMLLVLPLTQRVLYLHLCPDQNPWSVSSQQQRW